MKLNCSFHLMGDVMLGRDFNETRGSWSVRSPKSSRFLQCLVPKRKSNIFYILSFAAHRSIFADGGVLHRHFAEEIRLVILVYCIESYSRQWLDAECSQPLHANAT
jgi:hypothetical protein